jgi:hypothetical protein
MRYHYFKNIIIAIISIITVCYSCGGFRCNPQSKELIDSIYSLLISEKFCSDENDCRNKEYVYYGSPKDVYISVYGITDQTIVKKIVNLCIEKHKNNKGIRYELTMYSQTKREDVKMIISKKPMLELTLKKEE